MARVAHFLRARSAGYEHRRRYLDHSRKVTINQDMKALVLALPETSEFAGGACAGFGACPAPSQVRKPAGSRTLCQKPTE